MSPSNERSAEWLRGAVDSHINTCNLITSITSATKSHPAWQGLMAAGNELHNQLDRYRTLLAAAEAREGGENQALPLAELQRKHGELACELLSAATVIEAAGKALHHERQGLQNLIDFRGFWFGGERRYGALTMEELTDAIKRMEEVSSKLARWKEANGVR